MSTQMQFARQGAITPEMRRVAERENLPAYIIFNNQTLEFLTRLRPTTMAAGLRIRGIAEKKAEKYLEPFLAVIRAHR